MKYRREIDGLRSIAVLPVILFHAGFNGFNGGYIGVDIFFVISGYLITTIILEEKRSNKFSIINFYERRARRIIPALTMVLLFSTIAAYVLMPPNLLNAYSKSLFSVSTFSSNIFFYLTSGYFSTAADEKPLLHTWSLAVEEQYYIFFPVMVSMLWSNTKFRLIFTILIASGSSLLFAQYLSTTESKDANFYLIFSRAWELFFGSIIAFKKPKEATKKWIKEAASILGVVSIFYSIYFFDDHTPFPSFHTLIPVLGTCIIIVFADKTTVIGRLLGKQLLVNIGLISYSLYLWHQPLFSFLRMKTVGTPAQPMFLIAIFITFLLAYFSYKYIETPYRNKTKFSRNHVFSLAIGSIVIFSSIGLAGYHYQGFDSRFSSGQYSASIISSPKRDECHTKGTDYLPPVEACRYFGDNVTWAAFGDSHVVEPAYELAKNLGNSKTGLLHLSFSGCPPALLFETKLAGCSAWIKDSLDYLENQDNIKNILLGFRYSRVLFGDQLRTYPAQPNTDPRKKYIAGLEELSTNEIREQYWLSLKEITRRLAESGKRVFILYPIPELPMSISKAVTPFSILSDRTTLNLEESTTAKYYLDRNKFIIKKLDTLPYGNSLIAIKPLDILCDDSFCPAVNNEQSLYYDSNHLSLYGSSLLVANIIKEFNKVPQQQVN